MKKLIAILMLTAATASGQYLGETNVQAVTALVFIPYGTNHYTNGWWWTNSAYVLNTNLGLSLNDGGAVMHWAAWRAVNANMLFLQSLITNSFLFWTNSPPANTNLTNWLVFRSGSGTNYAIPAATWP
jgi:hypothetical protein